MKISYQYLTTDELDVSIKDIFDYIKFLHTDSDMSIKSTLSYMEEWELNKEEIIQALYGTLVYTDINSTFYKIIEDELIPYLKRADGESS
jgi:hypothetical protein